MGALPAAAEPAAPPAAAAPPPPPRGARPPGAARPHRATASSRRPLQLPADRAEALDRPVPLTLPDRVGAVARLLEQRGEVGDALLGDAHPANSVRLELPRGLRRQRATAVRLEQ